MEFSWTAGVVSIYFDWSIILRFLQQTISNIGIDSLLNVYVLRELKFLKSEKYHKIFIRYISYCISIYIQTMDPVSSGWIAVVSHWSVQDYSKDRCDGHEGQCPSSPSA